MLLTVALLAGCAGQSEPGTEDAGATGPATSTSSSSAAPSGGETTAPADGGGGATTPFPAGTDAAAADPVAAEGLTVTAVRVGRHDGYDRVVLELAGSGTPGWTVEYVDSPAAQGSGDPIDVPGAAYLQVTLQGTSYPYESGAEEVPRGAVAVSGTEAVQGVFYDATFEGTSVAVIGTAARTPFRVSALSGPSRVVVEVADAP